MGYWSEDRLKAMKKIQKRKIRNRKIAIGLLIPELLLSLTATIIAILSNELLWIVVFALFFILGVYVLIKQIQFLRDDLSWKPRDPQDYHPDKKAREPN
jgi:hypothetical protein